MVQAAISSEFPVRWTLDRASRVADLSMSAWSVWTSGVDTLTAGAKILWLDFLVMICLAGTSTCLRCSASLRGLTFGPGRIGLTPRMESTADFTFRIGVGLPSWASLMVSAMELSDSMVVMVLRDAGDSSNAVTRSTSLSVAEATRRKVLPGVNDSHEQARGHSLLGLISSYRLV
jgi:hypothetical protein